MKPKILVLSIYPAPYRVELIKKLSKEFEMNAFFDFSNGDQRDKEWFQQGEYFTLDTETGRKAYHQVDLKQYRLAIIYDYTTREGIKLISRSKHDRLPYIINCDGVMMEKHGSFVRDAIKRYLIKGAAGYFASGENAKQYFLQFGADESKIYIHTFSELEDNDILKSPMTVGEKVILRRRLGLPDNKKIAIAVGRFIPLKRYDKLIKAWKDIPNDYLLLLIGGGIEEENYRRIINDNDIKNVIIKDFVIKEKLFDYYKASDVFVHPTSYDVWGLVVNEAMACGLPVVVSDHCVAGLELIKNGENGYQIPMGNDKKMCERIVEILGNTELYQKMSHNVLETIRPYTMSNMAKVQIDAIKEIIEK